MNCALPSQYIPCIHHAFVFPKPQTIPYTLMYTWSIHGTFCEGNIVYNPPRGAMPCPWPPCHDQCEAHPHKSEDTNTVYETANNAHDQNHNLQYKLCTVSCLVVGKHAV